MSKLIFIGLGRNIEDNKSAFDEVTKLGNVSVVSSGDTILLDEYINLPFIETENKQRYYGLDSIQKYVKTQIEDNAILNYKRDSLIEE